MAIKKRISTSGKATPKRENTGVTRTSALAEPAGQLYGLVKKLNRQLKEPSKSYNLIKDHCGHLLQN